MKKIGVYLEGDPYSGGVFQYAQAILSAVDTLDKNVFEIYILYSNKIWESYIKVYDFKKIDISYNRYKNIIGGLFFRTIKFCGYDIALIRNIYSKINILSRKIDSLKLDILICPAQEILPAIIRTECIATIHDLMHRYEDFPEVNVNGEYNLREYKYKNICIAAKKIFVDSQVGGNQVIESYGDAVSSRICVMPFTPPQYLLNSNVENVHLEIPDKYIFYPAQFWLHKNHKNLIMAIKKVEEKNNLKINLILVGSKKNGYNDVLRLIDKLNLSKQIKILGYVSNEEMCYLYSKARAMVMPTFFGPTNIPPLEAMSMGCPVAVSNIYGMPEQIGKAGLTFDPKNIEEIANVLKTLWTDDLLCENLIQEGLVQIKRFSQEKFNERFVNVIYDILIKKDVEK